MGFQSSLLVHSLQHQPGVVFWQFISSCKPSTMLTTHRQNTNSFAWQPSALPNLAPGHLCDPLFHKFSHIPYAPAHQLPGHSPNMPFTVIFLWLYQCGVLCRHSPSLRPTSRKSLILQGPGKLFISNTFPSLTCPPFGLLPTRFPLCVFIALCIAGWYSH